MRKAILFILFFIFDFCPIVAKAAPPDLVISEIMYDLDGSDSNREWVEVYNGGAESVEILGGSGDGTWRFNDGANHIINLIQGEGSVAPSQYFIIASNAEVFLSEHPGFGGMVFDTVMSLSNSSSTIYLSFDGGQSAGILACYEETWGAGGNGKTLEKINLNQDSVQSNWQESFVVGGTPGLSKSQIIENPPSDDDPDPDPIIPNNPDNHDPAPAPQASRPANYWSQIKISEFLPNTVGVDDNEWIELFNNGDNTVDLSGFKLQDNSATIYTLSQDLILAARAHLVLYKNQSKISLNNTGGDSVKVYSPDNNLLDSVVYSTNAPEGKSYALVGGSFVWTSQPTPGETNILPQNQAPLAVIKTDTEKFFVGSKIIFSAEASSDPEEGELKYFWEFGDGQTGDEIKENHVYENPGDYMVKLKVTDSEGLSVEVTRSVKIENKILDTKLTEIKPIDFQRNDLIISEFVPNPIGNDDGEWIEIYNISNKDIDLLAWQIDDQDGGSKPYVFASSTIIQAGNFLLIDRVASQVTLNNNEDSVRILTPLGELWQEAKYQNIPEGQSYAWDLINQEWYINDAPSPSQANIQNSLIEAAAEAVYRKGENTTTSSVVWAVYNKILYSLDVYGGVLEVYGLMDFSLYKRGDRLSLNGKTTRVDPWPRIKINNQDNIIILEQNQEIARMEPVESSELSEDLNGQLLTVRGVVVKKNGKNIYLADEPDNDYNIRLSLKFDAKDLKINTGTEIIVTGILNSTEKGNKLDVFNKDDLQLEQKVLGEKIEQSASTTNVSPSKVGSSVKNIIKIILLAFVLFILVYFVFKRLRK